VAGLCRLLAQDGFRVAPFKSQNMSLNAYVAPDGGEMGWAQAMQAEAARVPARVEMNPILLKPRADAMSQVVLLGKALRDMPAREYYRQGARLWPAVRASKGEIIAASRMGKWKTGFQWTWVGATFFWFAAATAAAQYHWTGPWWIGFAYFNGTVNVVSMVVAVILTLYSQLLYLQRPRT